MPMKDNLRYCPGLRSIVLGQSKFRAWSSKRNKKSPQSAVEEKGKLWKAEGTLGGLGHTDNSSSKVSQSGKET